MTIKIIALTLSLIALVSNIILWIDNRKGGKDK